MATAVLEVGPGRRVVVEGLPAPPAARIFGSGRERPLEHARTVRFGAASRRAASESA